MKCYYCDNEIDYNVSSSGTHQRTCTDCRNYTKERWDENYHNRGHNLPQGRLNKPRMDGSFGINIVSMDYYGRIGQ